MVDVARPIKFGRSLGLKKSTLEKIERRYQDVDQRVTEVLAAWLEGRDGTPEPNWRAMIAALRSADMTGVVHRLTGKLSGTLFHHNLSCTCQLIKKKHFFSC